MLWMQQSLLASLVVLCAVFIGHHVCAKDVDVLQYALVLEHLEYAFYRDGVDLVKQAYTHARFKREKVMLTREFQKLAAIRDHEKSHVDALTNVIASLGATPNRECVYNFGYKTAADFIAIARILENVGVSAYTGAAYKITNQNLLTTAAAIATIEARHASYLNTINSVSPFPNAFDSPLDMKAVVGLVGGFIVSCPDAIPITPYPELTVIAPTKKLSVGSVLATTGNFTVIPTMHCVFYAGFASVNSTLGMDKKCVIPNDAPAGDNFVFVMTSTVYDFSNSAKVVAGPALIVVE